MKMNLLVKRLSTDFKTVLTNVHVIELPDVPRVGDLIYVDLFGSLSQKADTLFEVRQVIWYHDGEVPVALAVERAGDTEVARMLRGG